MKVPAKKVKITNKSVQRIQYIKDLYTQVYSLPDYIADCVIHMYPKEDTTVEGYMTDNLACAIKIYMPCTKTVYVPNSYFNYIDSNAPNTTQVFKDGSTLVAVGQLCKVVLKYPVIQVRVVEEAVRFDS